MERGPAEGLGKWHFPKRNLLIPSGNQRRLASGSATSTPSGPAPLTQVKPGRERTLRGPGGAAGRARLVRGHLGLGSPPRVDSGSGPQRFAHRCEDQRLPAAAREPGGAIRGIPARRALSSQRPRPPRLPRGPEARARRARERCRRSGGGAGSLGARAGGARAEVRGAVAALRPRSEGRTVGGRRGSPRGAGAERAAAPRNQVSSLRSPCCGRPHLRRPPGAPAAPAAAARVGM